MADLLEPGVWTPEGKKWLLEIAFLGKTPGDLWGGLCRRPQGEIDLIKLTSLEPRGATGYKRKKLTLADWRLDGVQVVSKMVSFSNFSGDQLWPPLDVGFVATTEDASGVLLVWAYLRTTRTLMPGEELVFPWRLGFA